MYRGMLGSFLYLTTSRPDIMFRVCVYARFQVRPKEVHLQAVKRILRYLKATANLGTSFYRSQNFSLLGYCDADYVRNKWERKKTSRGCHFLGRCLVSWTSKRQSTIALSTCKAEYVAAGQCLTQLLWIKHQRRTTTFMKVVFLYFVITLLQLTFLKILFCILGLSIYKLNIISLEIMCQKKLLN
uniref:Retrovirus-related Pol polyprotein from transposon TNT 1-94 n=1 Tax=Cajanus cajan TaxID=3821 RepID=A0A151TZ90_CAJCA|nr:hypothetical protein KK1_004919 [Cajanus cajan]